MVWHVKWYSDDVWYAVYSLLYSLIYNRFTHSCTQLHTRYITHHTHTFFTQNPHTHAPTSTQTHAQYHTVYTHILPSFSCLYSSSFNEGGVIQAREVLSPRPLVPLGTETLVFGKPLDVKGLPAVTALPCGLRTHTYTDTHTHTHTILHTVHLYTRAHTRAHVYTHHKHTHTHTHLLLLLCSPCPLGTLGRICLLLPVGDAPRLVLMDVDTPLYSLGLCSSS